MKCPLCPFQSGYPYSLARHQRTQHEAAALRELTEQGQDWGDYDPPRDKGGQR